MQAVHREHIWERERDAQDEIIAVLNEPKELMPKTPNADDCVGHWKSWLKAKGRQSGILR